MVLRKFVSGLIPRLTSAGDTGAVTCQREGDIGDWTSRLISFEIKRLIFPWCSGRFQPLSRFFLRKVPVSPMVLKNLRARSTSIFRQRFVPRNNVSTRGIFANKHHYNLEIREWKRYFSVSCPSDMMRNYFPFATVSLLTLSVGKKSDRGIEMLRISFRNENLLTRVSSFRTEQSVSYAMG